MASSSSTYIDDFDLAMTLDKMELYNIHQTLLQSIRTKTPEEQELMVMNYFTSADNPFQCLIDFLQLLPSITEFKVKPKSMPYIFVKAFSNMLNDPNNAKVRGTAGQIFKNKCLSKQIKLNALNILMDVHTPYLIEHVAEIFSLSEGLDNIAPIVTRMKEKLDIGLLEQVSYLATVLKLQEHFSCEEFYIPMVALSRQDLLLFTLQGCRIKQLEMVKYVDHLTVDKHKADELTRAIIGSKAILFTPKSLTKLVRKLVKEYNIPEEYYPNVSSYSYVASMKLVLHKRFIEGNISDQNWEEWIERLAEAPSHLQKEMVMSVHEYNDVKSVAALVKSFGMDPQKLPSSIQDALADYERYSHVQPTSSPGEDWDSELAQTEIQRKERGFYKLKLPVDCIKFVDDKDKFTQFLDEISEKPTVLGIDMEWKPILGNETTSVALIQIASKDTVWLFDLVSLYPLLSPTDWKLFLQRLFMSENTTLGFSFASDLANLGKSLPFLQNTLKKCQNYLDLQNLWTIMRDYRHIIHLPEHQTFVTSRTLSDLVETIFGRPMDKSEQFSDWSKRPLREAQIIYSALDAFVLVELYETISEALTEHSLKDLFKKYSVVQTNVAKKAVKVGPILAKPGVPISTNKLKVIVASNMLGLIKYFRMVGVDAISCSKNDTTKKLIEIGKKEQRIVICSGRTYEEVLRVLGPHWCFCVQHDADSKSQLRQVLTHFNVNVVREDVFKRCLLCNSNQYIKVANHDMVELYNMYQNRFDAKPSVVPEVPKTSRKPVDCYFDDDDEDEDEDFFIATDESVYSKAQPARRDTSPTWWKNKGSKWWKLEGGCLDIELFKTDKGTDIIFDDLNPSKMDIPDTYLICSNCGKVYWEGCHMARTITELEDFLLN